MTSLEDAINLLLQNVYEKQVEWEFISNLTDRVLAQDIFSPIDNPPFPKSPLDGYAVKAMDIKDGSKSNGKRLKVIDKIYAGDVSKKVVEEGTCVRLMTGAHIPPGADCIVRQEDCKSYDGYVDIYTSHEPYDNYCHQGEDFKKNDKVLEKNIIVKSSHIMALASLGIDKVLVYKKAIVGIITTGSEIQNPGEFLNPGKIFNSNGYFINSRLLELGVNPIMFDLAKDEEKCIIDALKKASDSCDIVVTTGGVSVGEKDIVKECAIKCGYDILFHGIDIKPGSPMFGAKNSKNTLLIALSGTPVAAATTFELFVRPVISKMLNCKDINYKIVKGIMQDEFPRCSNKRRFLRINIQQKDVNKVYIDYVYQSPGQIHTMVNSNGIIEVPKGTVLNKNDEVDVILL